MPGRPSTELFGRGEQLAEIDERLMFMSTLRRLIPRVRVDHGPRGVGKTSVLRAAQRLSHDRGAVSCWVTAGVGPGRNLLLELGDGLSRLSREQGWEGEGRLRGALERLSVSLTLGVPGMAQLSATKSPAGVPSVAAGTASLKAALVEAAGAAVGHGASGVTVFIDEIQDADRGSLQILGHAWQELQSEAAGVPLGVFAAGLPGSATTITKAASFTERMMDFRPMVPLTSDAVRVALAQLALNVGVRWEPQALEAAVLHARGHPFVLQMIGDAAWAAAGRPDPGAVITAEHVVRAARDSQVSMQGLFRSRWERASPVERTMLEAMAQLGVTGEASRSDIEAATGLSHDQLSVHRSRLMDKGLIDSPGHGVMAFTIPGFAEWIRDRSGVEDVQSATTAPESSRQQLLDHIQRLQQQLAASQPASGNPPVTLTPAESTFPPDSEPEREPE